MKSSDFSDVSRTYIVEHGPATLYRQDPSYEMHGKHISDSAYEEVVRNLVVVCTDVVFVDPQTKSIYLATRHNLPMRGLWWIGGRMLAGETSLHAIHRNLARETSLNIDISRFVAVPGMTRYQWSQHAQKPTNVGSDTLCYTFYLKVSESELVRAEENLIADEYDKTQGLQPFDREALEYRMAEGTLHPVIWDVYNQIFPTRQKRFRTWLANVVAS